MGGVPGPIVGKHGNTYLNEDQGRMRRWRRVGVEVFGCGRNVSVNVAIYLFQKLPGHLQRYADISDKVSELHARPLSVVSITYGLYHKMTTSGCFLVKFVHYSGNCKNSSFKFIDLAAVVGTETSVLGLLVALSPI